MEKLTRAASLQIVSDNLTLAYCTKIGDSLIAFLPIDSLINLHLRSFNSGFTYNLALFSLLNPSLQRTPRWMSVEGGTI